MTRPSPFLQSTTRSEANSLAIVHLSRDNLIPIILKDPADADDGYAEGAVLNSRFGSFPHSTLIGQQWGSQIRASTVDTGSRGRKGKTNKKENAGKTADAEPADESGLKRIGKDLGEENPDEKDSASNRPKLSPNGDTVEVADGLQPKQESGDDEEAHAERKRKRALKEGEEDVEKDVKRPRTAEGEQPDAKPEPAPATSEGEQPTKEPVRPAVTAASGFVHILKPSPELWTISLPHRTQVVYTPDYSYILQRIRAFPGKRIIEAGAGSGSFTHASARAVFNGFPKNSEDEKGKVFSFELNDTRYKIMKEEIAAHGLDGVVQITHRDVYNDGFNVDGKSPRANAVFLDVPAPWEALPKLSRRRPALKVDKDGASDVDMSDEWMSPLDPEQSVYICTFSPCIEQVIKTVDALRELGWTEIDMVEVSQRRFIVQRERVGMNLPAEKGTLQVPANVEEAITRLQAIGERTLEYHAKSARGFAKQSTGASADDVEMQDDAKEPEDERRSETAGKKEEEEDSPAATSKPWPEGRLIHRPETELKTHTSYLVFAILPREWTDEDETAALAKWPCGKPTAAVGILDKASRKKARRELLQPKKKDRQSKGKTVT